MPEAALPGGRILGWWSAVGIVLVVALGFQGTRGLWEPDEGRYANGALNMMESGEWLVPKLHDRIYLDKPPTVFWTIAGGLAVLGQNEWGARAGHALLFGLTALVVGAWATAAYGKRAGPVVAALYATTLMPAVAANILTPDSLLALAGASLSYCYHHYREEGEVGRQWSWAFLLGLSVGLGFLIKGPAILVFTAPIIAHLFWERRWKWLLRPELWAAGTIASLLGGSWYWTVATRLPGAGDYFFDNMVAGRLWENHYHRNGEWWKPLRVYGLSLAVGTLPWSAWALPRRKESIADRTAALRSLTGDPHRWFLFLSIVIPLAILSLASSRLPLYALPVLPAIVMSIYPRLAGLGARVVPRILCAAVALLALKALGGWWVSHNDARHIANALTANGVPKDDCVDALQVKAHGLKFYGYDRLTWHTIWEATYPQFETPTPLQPNMDQLLDDCGGSLWLLSPTENRSAVIHLGSATAARCDTASLTPRHDLTHCLSPVVAGPA